MEVPRLGVQSELQLLAFALATATQDPSRVGDLCHSSWQCQILNPLSEASDRTLKLMVPSRIHFCSQGFISFVVSYCTQYIVVTQKCISDYINFEQL